MKQLCPYAMARIARNGNRSNTVQAVKADRSDPVHSTLRICHRCALFLKFVPLITSIFNWVAHAVWLRALYNWDHIVVARHTRISSYRVEPKADIGSWSVVRKRAVVDLFPFHTLSL
jgi:hypothetical protein